MIDALEDIKGLDIVSLDISDQTDISDYMVVASGATSRQVKALVNNVVVEAKKAGFEPLGVEGLEQGEWVLVDLGDIVVHVMQPHVREFYDLEKLWDFDPKEKSNAI